MFLQLHQELPYATMVETDSWEERDDGSVKIAATIHVQRASQKAIVLGKGGSRIKAIASVRAPSWNACSAAASTSFCSCG